MTDWNLSTLLLDHPAEDGSDLLHGSNRTWTAGEARTEARDLAGQLRGAGVELGEAVAVHLPNGPEVVIAMTAIWLVGAVFVPVNNRLPDPEVERILADTDPSVVIGVNGLVERPGEHTRYDPGVALVLWTSGTSGNPKPVLHTHAAYVELLDRVLGPLQGGSAKAARKPAANLIPVSMALNAGVYNAMFGMRAGAPLVIMDRFSAQGFIELVQRHAIRSSVLPPAAMNELLDQEIDDLSPLRYIRSITAPLTPVLARRFTERFGVIVLNGYGQSEIGEVIGWTAADAKSHPDKIGAVGRPHPGVDIRIDAPDDNGVGELLVNPPSRATGYASDDDLADRLTADGFVRTGDLARVDNEGFVWIEGRLGDVINRGGNKVFPAHVEEALMAVDGVVDAAVVAGPDERLGEIPIAFVVTDRDVSDDELETTCRTHLAPYKVPDSYQHVESLPRNEIGKILRRDLIARLE
ncbi:MAG: AMP-binding protein [Ilumatobacteraceae bacterium]|nr:AMP-binding protein [Ilumatobacteraceae bacterium]